MGSTKSVIIQYNHQINVNVSADLRGWNDNRLIPTQMALVGKIFIYCTTTNQK